MSFPVVHDTPFAELVVEAVGNAVRTKAVSLVGVLDYGLLSEAEAASGPPLIPRNTFSESAAAMAWSRPLRNEGAAPGGATPFRHSAAQLIDPLNSTPSCAVCTQSFISTTG